jgi:NAD(P)-dependent dehydrogenase (short-subunit alcohol dehydrogenase family)
VSRFDGKIVLVTGGNSGLGAATARAFAREGAEVIVSGRNRQTLDEAVASIGAKGVGMAADVGKLADIERLMAAIKARSGRLDVLFANAGITRFGPIGSVTEADWDAVMDANLKGLYFTVQQALPLMGKGGSIVLNASVASSVGAPDSSVYSASKAAVRSLGRSLGAELVGRGIRVNVVSPGPIDTPIFAAMGMKPPDIAQLKEAWAASNPMKRFGEPDEVARAVLFLASADASYITGANLTVDGGLANF